MFSKLKHHRWTLTASIFIAIFIGLAGIFSVYAQSGTTNKVIIYLFWGDGCPHCAEEKPFLEELIAQNPNVEVRAYEIWKV